MSYEPHKPGIWFREGNGTIHWRCHACDSILPTTGPDYPGYESAWAEEVGKLCSRTPDPLVPKAWKERKSRHQLGREVRRAWVAWAERQVAPKPSWLVAYEHLSYEDQEADQCIGWELSMFLLRTLTDWHTTQLSEDELCRRLGLDRMAWRDIRDQLGMTQVEEAPAVVRQEESP
jgi:hypothetical protein